MNASDVTSGFHPVQQIQSLDTSIFRTASQTAPADKRSLLAIQNVVRNAVAAYTYLEVGSHLGGTLLPHLVDPMCRHVISVDKRPMSQPDERGVMFDYRGNSTERMIETLAAHVPASALLKLTTHDADLSEVTPGGTKADLIFIDAEHTNIAVFSDFIAARRFAAESSIIAFHDANLIFDCLQIIEMHLGALGVPFRSFFLPAAVFIIVTGEYIELAEQPLKRFSIDRKAFLQRSRIELRRLIAKNVAQINQSEPGEGP